MFQDKFNVQLTIMIFYLPVKYFIYSLIIVKSNHQIFVYQIMIRISK